MSNKQERPKSSVWFALTIHVSHLERYTLALKLVTSDAKGYSTWFVAYHEAQAVLGIIYVFS